MGYGITVTDEQWDELDRFRFSTSSVDVFRNCLIILMSHSKNTIACIAQRLGCSTDMVIRVRELCRQGGVAASRPIKPPGRRGGATPQFVQQMKQAVQTWLAAQRQQIEIYWLPPYCPSLNLIERLWGHLKRTVLANVLFQSLDDLTSAFRRGVAHVNGHRERRGFMFDHDDLLNKKVA
jgi:hypothetical protein